VMVERKMMDIDLTITREHLRSALQPLRQRYRDGRDKRDTATTLADLRYALDSADRILRHVPTILSSAG
jgi:hypothetical protein